MIAGIPPNQIVEVGSVWDVRNREEEAFGYPYGDLDDEDAKEGPDTYLFEVMRIKDGIAYNETEEEGDGFSIPIDDLAKNFRKLTPEEVAKIEKDSLEYHKSTIRPIKKDGKIIQVGSVWDVQAEDKNGKPSLKSRTVIVRSLSPDVVWSGERNSGIGTMASELSDYGREIPFSELADYFSKKETEKMMDIIKEDSEHIHPKEVHAGRVLDNGRLINYSLQFPGPIDKDRTAPPEIIYHDREATEEEKKEIAEDLQKFIDWAMKERALAAEPARKIMQRMTAKRPRVNISLLQKEHTIAIPQNSSVALPNEIEKSTNKKHQKERLKA